MVAPVESVESRHFLTARRTPGGPKVHDYNFPTHAHLDQMSVPSSSGTTSAGAVLPTVAEANANAATQMIAATPAPANHNVFRLFFSLDSTHCHELASSIFPGVIPAERIAYLSTGEPCSDNCCAINASPMQISHFEPWSPR